MNNRDSHSRDLTILGSLPTPPPPPTPVSKINRRLIGRLRRRRERGKGMGQEPIIRPQEILVLYKSFSTLWLRKVIFSHLEQLILKGRTDSRQRSWLKFDCKSKDDSVTYCISERGTFLCKRTFSITMKHNTVWYAVKKMLLLKDERSLKRFNSKLF